jgi:hypothetical protein
MIQFSWYVGSGLGSDMTRSRFWKFSLIKIISKLGTSGCKRLQPNLLHPQISGRENKTILIHIQTISVYIPRRFWIWICHCEPTYPNSNTSMQSPYRADATRDRKITGQEINDGTGGNCRGDPYNCCREKLTSTAHFCCCDHEGIWATLPESTYLGRILPGNT